MYITCALVLRNIDLLIFSFYLISSLLTTPPTQVSLSSPLRTVLIKQSTCTCIQIFFMVSDAAGNLTEVVGSSTDELYTNGTGRRVSRILATVSREMYLATYICNITVAIFYQQTVSFDLDLLCKLFLSDFDEMFLSFQSNLLTCQ